MTVRDLLDQVQIEGNHVFCQYNEKTEDLMLLTEQEAMDMEIKYIYPQIAPNGAEVYIEVESIYEEE